MIILAAAAFQDDVTSGAQDKDKPQKSKRISASTEALQEFIKLMEEENLDELEISDGAVQIKLVRQHRPSPVIHAAPPSKKSAVREKTRVTDNENAVKSPLAGVFYRAPSPQAPPFVAEGDTVTSGQKLCIIEAMKVMNEITTPKGGRIIKILVENGQPVQSGQPLFVIEP